MAEQNPNFENMIQVLSYFAEQCDLFKPMLDGVTSLQDDNTKLKDGVWNASMLNNRVQLNTTFSADYANFGINSAKSTGVDEESQENAKYSQQKDLYKLFKAVIMIGKDNYVKADMEYKLFFYYFNGGLLFDDYTDLTNMIYSQHDKPSVKPPTDPPPVEEVVPPTNNIETPEQQ